jgi:hypothetical protein
MCTVLGQIPLKPPESTPHRQTDRQKSRKRTPIQWRHQFRGRNSAVPSLTKQMKSAPHIDISSHPTPNAGSTRSSERMLETASDQLFHLCRHVKIGAPKWVLPFGRFN